MLSSRTPTRHLDTRLTPLYNSICSFLLCRCLFCFWRWMRFAAETVILIVRIAVEERLLLAIFQSCNLGIKPLALFESWETENPLLGFLKERWELMGYAIGTSLTFLRAHLQHLKLSRVVCAFKNKATSFNQETSSSSWDLDFNMWVCSRSRCDLMISKS